MEAKQTRKEASQRTAVRSRVLKYPNTTTKQCLTGYSILNIAWSVISRHGQSKGPLYKHPFDSFIHSLIQSVSLFLPQLYAAATPKRLEIALPVIKETIIIVIKNFLNPEGHQNPISGSKVTAILLKGWALSIGGASLWRVWACSLRSRLASNIYEIY